VYRLKTHNKVLNSFATLTGMLRSYLAAHPLARRYTRIEMEIELEN
jgi:hypothetical protein